MAKTVHRFTNLFLLIGIVVLLFLVAGALHFSESPDTRTVPFNQGFRAYPVPMPDSMNFAGEKVPMNRLGVKEALEQEMLINTYWQSQTLLMLKRTKRYFPTIEAILKKDSVPDDFKYLALAESALGYNVSKAGAAGIWQLMKNTAHVYGLTVNKYVDERYNLVKSTEAACQYFNNAYSVLHNWTLVAASYNMGIEGIERTLRDEKENSYYNLSLNIETRRYIFRILALKQLVTHPTLYGYYLSKADFYKPIPSYTVSIDSSVSSLADFAKQNGISYYVLKFLNPWLISDKLPNPESNTYIITLPKIHTPFTELGENITYADSTLPAALITKKDSAQPRIIVHVVQACETLPSIAKQYHVSVKRLCIWNSISDTLKLKPGDEIMIFEKPNENNNTATPKK